MATTFKGIYKSLKHITQIFVVKEREMEIGYPTDVKHVAHVGWDGTGPSWMNELQRGTNFATSLGNMDEFKDPNPMAGTALWSNQESQQSCAGVSHSPEKPKQTKNKSASFSQSPSSSKKRSRAAKWNDTYRGREATPIALV